MASAGRDAEIAEIDALLTEQKALRGGPPQWEASSRGGFQANWTVEDRHGAARAQLRFTCRRSANPYPTFALVFRNRLVWLVEIEDPPLLHRNPYWVGRLELPAIVSGSHEHRWSDNRDHLGIIAPEWELSARRPLASQVRRLPQALASFASDVHLAIDSTQRLFDVPPQAEMFP
jgi:hypothetical protein